MFNSNVPKCVRGDAILTVCYLINRVPSRVLSFRSPLSVLSNSIQDSRSYSGLELKVFGCTAFVHNLDPNRSKLEPHSHKCVFLGYSTTQKGYRCYSPEKRKYFVSRDVTFFEDEPYFKKTETEGEIQRFFSEISSPEKLADLIPYPSDLWEKI